MKPNRPPRDLSPTDNYRAVGATTNVYRNAAVYRSLEVPQPTPQLRTTSAGVDKPLFGLQGPAVTNAGDVLYKEAKAGVQAFPSASHDGTAQETKPLPIPMIYANVPHNMLYVNVEPVSAIVDECERLFQKHDVDTTYNAAKFKWKCVSYSSQRETSFVCKLYSVPDRANYFALDFERRSGDAFQFNSIYKSINNELVKTGFMVACPNGVRKEEPTVLKTFTPFALPDDYMDDDEMEEEKIEAKDYEPLLHMCLSPYIDVQREGLAALASQLESNTEARGMLASFSPKLMDAVAGSRDSQVRRLALTCVGSMAASAPVAFTPQEMQVITNFVLQESECMETRRQAAKLVLCMFRQDQRLARDCVLTIKNASLKARDVRFTNILAEIQACV